RLHRAHPGRAEVAGWAGEVDPARGHAWPAARPRPRPTEAGLHPTRPHLVQGPLARLHPEPAPGLAGPGARVLRAPRGRASPGRAPGRWPRSPLSPVVAHVLRVVESPVRRPSEGLQRRKRDTVNVPLTRPWTSSREKELLDAVIDSGWWTQGPRVTDFEKAIAARIGVAHAVASSNCTTALHIALLLQGVGAGDEVIVPSYTWIATPNVVRMVGATPVFVDIDLATFNVTADAVERAITARTKSIMPVHQFGLPADMDAIAAVGRRHG